MRDGQWEVDGRGLTEQAREFAAGKVVHLRLTKVDGSVARGACEDPGALGQWWSGVPAEVTCGECRETLFRRGPTTDPAVRARPGEFLAWLLGIPPSRQLEVVEKVLADADAGLACWQFNHHARLEEWQARTTELLGRLEAVGLTADSDGHGVGMTTQTPEGEPTTEVSVETPAKDETTVEVADPAADPAPASTTHVETTVEQS